MSKDKSGLHKNVSSIFDGVPVPKGTGVQKDKKSASKFKNLLSKSSTSKRVSKGQSKSKASSGNGIGQKISAYISSLSDKENRKKAITTMAIPVLAIVLIFALSNTFKNPKSGRKAKSKDDNKSAAKIVKDTITWEKPELVKIDFRDPMRISGSSTQADHLAFQRAGQSSSKQLSLMGIVSGNDEYTAIINNQIVHAGEIIGFAEVVNISNKTVDIKINNENVTLKVGQRYDPPVADPNTK